MTEDPKKRGYQAMGELGSFFPSGFKAKVAEEYLNKLYRDDFTNEDIVEGVQREIATRQQRSFPPYAELRARVVEARNDRILATRSRLDVYHGQRFWNDEAGKEKTLETFRALRAELEAGNLEHVDTPCPIETRGTAMPVRGAPLSSPAYRDTIWWNRHPEQTAGTTLRKDSKSFTQWHKDKRPWAMAEADHARYAKPNEKTKPMIATTLGSYIRDVLGDQVPF